ncbi:Gfo/Idh/MocA family protein [Mangrovibacterium marinum]|uniref:Putative dehydrogenase n=1 Tax=Mangrovibacterium marinum TaxID=1639118 RepID=A0A2T5C0R1_9BACT|nr:Gfo/Idh/MocA family oxidoreductase [Mangrovibacterium marinum]PTN08196.1 putative dehydrogenase [Mangrovibacterium marinum]
MKDYSRRNFLSKIAIGSTAVMAYSTYSCNRSSTKIDLPLKASDGKILKAGLIGCGSRGTGAAINFLDAGPNLELVALGDIFQDKLNKCRQNIREKRKVEISDQNCFVGVDAYEKVMDAGVDLVILATPPYFRPEHFKAAIRNNKHVFMEKPVAVDPVGARSIMLDGIQAQESGLKVVTGTIKRHQLDYINTHNRVKNGTIGEIISGNCYYMQGKLWHVNPQAQWSEMEAMIRNWVNWTWLSGDHIVEQHIHNIDLMNWFIGSHPESATGFGSRQRRITGDQYDNFSIDFTYPGNVHVNSMCRQINGCTNQVSDLIRGTKGYTNCENTIFSNSGEISWKYPLSEEQEKDPLYFFRRSYTQELVDLVEAIRTGTELNDAVITAESTLTAIMGRMSAYTGQTVSWDEVLNSELRLGPKTFVMGQVDMNKSIPVPGQ